MTSNDYHERIISNDVVYKRYQIKSKEKREEKRARMKEREREREKEKEKKHKKRQRPLWALDTQAGRWIPEHGYSNNLKREKIHLHI